MHICNTYNSSSKAPCKGWWLYSVAINAFGITRECLNDGQKVSEITRERSKVISKALETISIGCGSDLKSLETHSQGCWNGFRSVATGFYRVWKSLRECGDTLLMTVELFRKPCDTFFNGDITFLECRKWDIDHLWS